MRLGALNPEEPLSGVTVPVKIEYSQNRVDEVIESSRKLYAKKYTGSVDVSIKTKEKQASKRVYSALP
jgi:hypothetical protein